MNKIRYANNKDIDSIMQMINDAKLYLKHQQVDQWQNGYPNDDTIKSDIYLKHGYVIENESEVIGYFAIQTNEPSYTKIEGQWLNDDAYICIHRLVISHNYKGQGIANCVIDDIKNKCFQNEINNIRIDTHIDNISMRNFLKKNNFYQCGMICLSDGSLRVAYQLVI